MNKEKLLVALVLADFALGVSGFAVDFALHWTLPPELRAVAGSTGNLGAVRDAVLTVLWYLSAAGFFVAWVGLASYWRPARRLYLVAWGLALLVTALGAPDVSTGPGLAFDAIGTLVSGALIGLVYFSDLSRRFEAPAVRPLAAVAG